VSALPFDRTVRTRVPAAWMPRLKTAAHAFDTTVSDYIREALTDALVNDGFAPRDPAPPADKTIGELQDVVEGRRQWYLIGADGAILRGPQLSAEKPDDDAIGTWLPVANIDSQPLDRRRHWRLEPELRVEADRVVRFYPVVRKSLEHM
jgi:hypothetical protein